MGSWTKAELEVLKSGKSVREIMTILNRSDSSVRNKAKRLGIQLERSSVLWTDEQLLYLKENIKRKTYDELSNNIGKSPVAIHIKANELGISYHAKSNINKKWTDKEDEYLKRNYSRSTLQNLSKALNRSSIAIRDRARILRIARYEKEYLNASELSACFGRNKIVATNWIRKHGLPAQKLWSNSHYVYMIDIDEFWAWADKNRTLIDWSGYIPLSLLPEPDFVKECIEEYSKPTQHRKKITQCEKIKIYNMYCKGVSIKEIAKVYERTEYAVKHILRDYQTELRCLKKAT